MAIVADARTQEVKDGCFAESRRFGCAAEGAKRSHAILPGGAGVEDI